MVFQWAKNWVVDKVYGVAKTGIEAGGTLAGNAVGGVGTLVENTGRGVAQSASGAVGGVGSYINTYGQGIIDSTAASGGGGEKKRAVKPAQNVSKTAPGPQKRLPAVTGTAKSLPPTKALPAAGKPSRPHSAAANHPLPAKKPLQPPQKPTDGKIRVSPASRPQPAKANAVGGSVMPKAALGSGGPKPLPRISAGKNDRTAAGKVKISPASRPRPVARAR